MPRNFVLFTPLRSYILDMQMIGNSWWPRHHKRGGEAYLVYIVISLYKEKRFPVFSLTQHQIHTYWMSGTVDHCLFFCLNLSDHTTANILQKTLDIHEKRFSFLVTLPFQNRWKLWKAMSWDFFVCNKKRITRT